MVSVDDWFRPGKAIPNPSSLFHTPKEKGVSSNKWPNGVFSLPT
jgi:hypothetical protein